MVWGFGAAGSDGKASSARVFGGAGPRPRDWDDDDDDAVHEGAEAVVDTRDDEDEDAAGREGNADAEGALDEEDDDDAATQPGGPREAVGAGPPSRVLFLSFKTLFEFRCEGATTVNFVLAAAALAHPLELEVAPCMPPRLGKLG